MYRMYTSAYTCIGYAYIDRYIIGNSVYIYMQMIQSGI